MATIMIDNPVKAHITPNRADPEPGPSWDNRYTDKSDMASQEDDIVIVVARN